MEELKIKLEANFRAIENAVTNAELDGGCDCAEYVRYHVEQLRDVVNDLINQPRTIQ